MSTKQWVCSVCLALRQHYPSYDVEENKKRDDPLGYQKDYLVR